jgi:hypothetical protein
MITEEQKSLLIAYKEKAFISALLSEESYNYYNFTKNIINIPLIITNSAMVVLNAIITDQDLLKILNIILNASTGLILSLIANFKIYENIQAFHQLQIKFNKLSHIIDSKLTNELDKINNEYISGVIEDYDAIIESADIVFPLKIRKRIKTQYDGKLSLPSSISVDIIECKTDCCCVKV